MIGSRRCVCPLSQCLYVNLGPLQRPTLPSSLQNDCRTGRLWRGRSCWLSPPQRTGAPTTRGLRCQLFNAIKTHRKTKSQSKGVYNVFSLWHKLKQGRLRKEICFYASFILVEQRLESLKAEFLADTGRDKGIVKTHGVPLDSKTDRLRPPGSTFLPRGLQEGRSGGRVASQQLGYHRHRAS